MLFVFLEGIWLIIAASTDPIRLPLTHVPFLRVRLEGAMYNYEISGTIFFSLFQPESRAGSLASSSLSTHQRKRSDPPQERMPIHL